jgi:photosystem II stability/assembly factor-like uncharacterized protein
MLTTAPWTPALALGLVSLLGAAGAHSAEPPLEAPKVTVKVVENGDSATAPDQCHTVLVGAGVNEPDPFPGYKGFVGWESPIRLRDGTLLVGFNAGYWHGSPPTQFEGGSLERFKEAWDMGMPKLEAPRGGRAMLIRSTDSGKTWSKPWTLADTPWDDRHPAFLELPDGTLLCTFFMFRFADDKLRNHYGCQTMVTRSTDHGSTWSEPAKPASPFIMDETDGPLLLAEDGSVYMPINGRPNNGTEPDQIAILRSTNAGKDWETLSRLQADHELSEPTITQLPDGTMIVLARPEGDLAWSYDKGKTWTPFTSLGMRLFAPSLQVLKDGTLLCIHGSYGGGGLRCTFSRDGGKTWIAPAANYGFLIDTTYGYGKGIELPDGSIFITYLKSGGHATTDAATNAVMCIRMRIRPDYSGIDLLPAPNR